MPFPGILDTLSPEQSDQLLTWLEIHPIQTVIELVAAPPPDGFGMKTHVTSLRRFYRRAQSRRMEEEAREADTAQSPPRTPLPHPTGSRQRWPNFFQYAQKATAESALERPVRAHSYLE